MESVWSANTKMPSFESLKKDIQTDVLIIGGGITGILCAYMLKNSGVNCTVAEADKICSGTTKNTTAKITCQHSLIYSKLEKEFGLEYARKYLKANQQALEKYKKLCEKISCDFEIKDNYVYSVSDEKPLEAEMEALNRLNCNPELVTSLPLPISTVGAVRLSNQAQFNPLKFTAEIAKDLNIYENTMIYEIDKHTAKSKNASIKADKIIVASHFPFINSRGLYFMKMYQHRSYVIALENADRLNGMYVDCSKKGYSFRQYGNLLLLGGGAHRTGKKGGGFQQLLNFKNTHYPMAKVKYRWAAQDCITLDSSAYIGHYSRSTPYIYTATGFNKWGMTASMAAAEILTDLVTDKKNEFAEIFSPSRTMLRPQLAVNLLETTANLLTPTTKRCPHLGCALKWNSQEHSWDCPCHGSRFEKEGKLIDNPAMKNAKV